MTVLTRLISYGAGACALLGHVAGMLSGLAWVLLICGILVAAICGVTVPWLIGLTICLMILLVKS